VLNIGFQAGILDTRTFSMFVLHALVLTFMVSSHGHKSGSIIDIPSS